MSYAEALSLLISAVVLPALLYLTKLSWELRRWWRFEREIARLARDEFIPEDLSREELRGIVAVKLSNAGYEPERTAALLEFAIYFAVARMSFELTGKYGAFSKEVSDGSDA